MYTNRPLLGLAILLALCPMLSKAQITGTVVDTENQPLAFANVLLLHAQDSSLQKGMLATEAGTYAFESIAVGTYLLQFQMGGYETAFSEPFSYEKGEKKMKTVQLGAKSVELDEVQIVAIKPLYEQQIDRLVVNVASTITNAGSTVLEVLERSPGVVVNRQSNSISIAGKDGVIVMINGKANRMPIEAAMSLLNGMSSNSVEKIELITTPPADFDAEGNAGIINIVLKQSLADGTNGSFALTAGYWWGEKAAASFNINHRKGKVNLYANYSFSRDHTKQFFINKRTISRDGLRTVLDTKSEREPVDWLNDLRVGIDVNLGPKTVMGGLVSAYNTLWDMVAYNTLTQKEAGILRSQVDIKNDEINEWNHISGNLNFQHSFSGDQKLTVNADYLYTHDNNPTAYVNAFSDGNGNLLSTEEVQAGKVTPINIWVGKIDYEQKLGEKAKWEAGLKGTQAEFLNRVNIENLIQGNWVEDSFFTQDYSLNEDIAAAYSSFEIKTSEKTSMKLGLRYEYTHSNLGSPDEPNIVDRRYGYLFPSVFLSRQLKNDQSLQFAYSRRISRPAYNDLAPFVIFLDPNTYFTGNAALQPGITDAFKLDYRVKKIIFSLNYSYEDSAIARYQPLIDAGKDVQLITSLNMDYVHSVSLHVFFPLKVSDGWNMQFSGTFGGQELHTFYNEIPTKFSYVGLKGNTTQTFSLPKEFTLEISAFYSSPFNYGIQKIRAMGAVNLGIQKKLPDDKGVFRLTWNDIFYTNNYTATTALQNQGFEVTSGYLLEPRVLKLTYSRNFGDSKIKGSRQRETGSEEERGRIN